MTLAGHLWTLLPHLRDRLWPPTPPPSRAWSTAVEGALGRVLLRGALHVPQGARDLVVLIHGLGGCASSSYLLRAAAVAARSGVASLRLSLRGAEGDGADLYHAGLASDLHVVLDSPALAGFERLYLLGYSLGGHLALAAASGEVTQPRLARVAAVCSPLDLALAQRGIDAPWAVLYRRNILRRLRVLHGAVAARHPDLPGDPQAVQDARTLRDFDAAAVVPRFGFAGVAEYYRQASVCHRLGHLQVPALLVAVREDPMIPAACIEACAAAAPGLTLAWLARGGHVHVPARVDLGWGAGTDPGALGPASLEMQLLAWLRCRGSQ